MEITIEKIATVWRLREAWNKVRKKGSAGGVDGVTIQQFDEKATSNITSLSKDIISGRYIPEPLLHIQKQKSGSREKRNLGLPSIKDKIVQNSLSTLLGEMYEPLFSNCSYAYRPGKGAIKAVNRVRDFLTRKNQWISTIDIDNFFDTINHKICLGLLSEKISDKMILRLIKLYLSNGVLKHDKWEDTYDGIPQGGVLSPVLSNIYLNEFDKYLHSRKIDFVRYADDFVMLTKTREILDKETRFACNFLKRSLCLNINMSAPLIMNTVDGFSFLGIYFHQGKIKIDYARIDSKIDKIKYRLRGSKNLVTAVKKINDFFQGTSRYYSRLLPESSQLDFIETSALKELSIFIASGLQKKIIKTKKECREKMANLQFIRQKDHFRKDILINRIIDDGFACSKNNKSEKNETTAKKSVRSAINKKKREYSRKILSETELVVSRFGHSIGYNQKKFTVKHKGIVVAAVPKEKLKRIVISSSGISLSSNLVKECSYKKIPVEFLANNGEPYAMLYSPQFAISRAVDLQINARNNGLGFELALQFVKGKAKNQINLLKYFNKYIKKKCNENSQRIESNIESMEKLLDKIQPLSDGKKGNFRNKLMGMEGSISHFYWNSVKIILPSEAEFKKRNTYMAKDLFNSVLNYGYGILYNRVQKALADAGAALHISFLHEPSGRKPTLVFDQIEEFRQFMVDRTIIAMFNKKEPLKTNKNGMLTNKTRQLIVENVQERLGSHIRWRGNQWKCEDIIYSQARLLVHHLNGDKQYRPFIGRF